MTLSELEKLCGALLTEKSMLRGVKIHEEDLKNNLNLLIRLDSKVLKYCHEDLYNPSEIVKSGGIIKTYGVFENTEL
ncbi:hypothetical protein JXA40_11860 [bacterium]|nr:hypothetical protein [candidate division CSSED10-310 bacterium]